MLAGSEIVLGFRTGKGQVCQSGFVKRSVPIHFFKVLSFPYFFCHRFKQGHEFVVSFEKTGIGSYEAGSNQMRVVCHDDGLYISLLEQGRQDHISGYAECDIVKIPDVQKRGSWKQGSQPDKDKYRHRLYR